MELYQNKLETLQKIIDEIGLNEYINAVKKFEKVDKQSKQKDISKQPSLSLILNTNHNLNKKSR